ncbi:MAG TPA: AAA family ATPase [Acidimicrobiales bacterium]|jgi:pilus assembly protein CpaE|nr:AAA family ATPase [Acidimicrobiales bacterium]
MRSPRVLVLDDTDDLFRQVERVTGPLRPHPDLVACESLEAVEEFVAGSGPFDLVIGGPLVSNIAGLQHLRRVHARWPEMKLVLALDRWRTTSLRDTVRTGALDILRLPVSDQDLLEAVEQAIEMAPAQATPPAAGLAPVTGKGTVIAVVSATGGCGKTFFATNLAYHLQSRFQKRTCLLDLDLQFGELSTALRLKPKYTIRDLVAQDDGDQDALTRRFEEYLEHHESGISLLAGPEEPAEADAIEASHVARVIEAARSRFDYVIVDTPAALSEAVLVALEQADQIFALATLDLPSVRNLGVMLATLKKLKVPPERLKLLLNKVEPDVGINEERVAQYFPQGFAMTIPYGREVNRSLNMGQPVLAYSPNGAVGRALSAGLVASLASPGESDGEPATAGRVRRRLFKKSA